MIDKITLFVGLNDKKTLRQEINTLEASKIITNIMSNKKLDCTISEAIGVYTMQDSKKVTIENSLRIEILFCNKENIIQSGVIETIKKALNQESIAMQYEVIDSELI